jgi:hypothetical protein
MKQRCSAAMAILLCLLAGGSPLAADDALRAHWTFDEPDNGEPTPIFQATQEAIDATTVVWRSKIVGQRSSFKEAADSSGNGNHARPCGAPLLTPGARQQAATLDGHDDFLEVADSPSLRITGAVTIEVWIRVDEANENGVLISKDFRYAGPSWCQMYFWGKSRHLQVAVNDDAGPTVVSQSPIEPGKWCHVAMTYDGRQRTRIYANGRLDCENTTRYHGPIPAGTAPLLLAKRADGHSFRGAMDDLWLFAEERTPAQVLADYEATRPADSPSTAPANPAATAEVQDAMRTAELVADGTDRRDLTVHWQHLDLQLPAANEDLARKANGAEFSASSTGGQLLLGEDEKPGTLPLLKIRWCDATRAQYPDWVEVRWPQPREIDTIVLRTFGEHVYGRNKEGIRSYEVQCARPDGGWLTVASVKDNLKEWLVHRFPATTTLAVRLVVTEANAYDELGWRTEICRNASSNGNFSRLQEFQVFNLGPKPAYSLRDVLREVFVEKAALGRVAIFKDKVPMPEGVAASPDYLAQVIRQAGYGVTFLDADLLSNSSLLSRENFDLFVQPYGCSFPLGTTLYDFLESGGHLITLGGRAFTDALVRSMDGQLLASGYDPGLILSPDKMVREDWFAQLREMLGIFAGSYQTFQHVATTRPAAGQFLCDSSLCIDGSLSGYPSTGMVGQIITDQEEAQFAQEGKEWDHYAKIRPVLWESWRKGQTPRCPEYHIFNKACSRWIALLESYDRFERPRGSVGGMMFNHDGRYRGSNWAFFGVTDRDLFAADNPQAATLLLNVVDHAIRATYLHGLTPGYYSYRQGEEVTARVFAANFGTSDRTGRLAFTVLPLHGDEPIFAQQRDIHLPKGRSTPIDLSWAPDRFRLDFYRLRCVLELDSKPVDQIETGIVIWNEKSLQADSAFDVRYCNNYFQDGQRPLFINGARTDGLQRIGQVGEDPLAWQREYRMMQENGISVASPVWIDVYLPGFGWDKELPELVPEKILRQMDAQVQLCQQHKVIYAPCLFFANREHTATTRRDLAHRMCELIGERYCKVPGIVFYLWDDGAYFGDDMRAAYNAFVDECVTGLSQNSAGRKYVVMAELKDSERIGTRRMFANHTVANHWGSGPWDIASARMADQRAVGRSQSSGEFYWWADRGEEAGHRFYLNYPHGFFALGYSWALNWKWRDNDHAAFSWGVVHPGDNIPKDCLYTWRNESWFFRSFRPKYVQPELMFVLPEFYWDKSQHVKDTPGNCRDVDATLFAEMSKLIALGYVDFGVIDDWDLDRLAPQTKALVYPAAFCPDDGTYQRLRDFVTQGGRLYLTGDISYEPQQQRRRPERLAELAGVAAAEPLVDAKVPISLAELGRTESIKPIQAIPGWKDPYSGRVALRLAAKGADVIASDAADAPVVVRHKLGQGRVLFNADVSATTPPALLAFFLEQAGLRRERAEPDDPDNLHVYRVPTHDGQVFGLAVRGGNKTNVSYDAAFSIDQAPAKREYTIVTSPAPVTLTLGRSPMVMAAFDGNGKLVACETDGVMKLRDKMVVTSTGSVMMFALDGQPIETSAAVVVLPQPFVQTDIQILTSTTLDRLEIGDLKDGAWQTHHQAELTHGPEGARFSVDQVQSLGVVLLTRHADRDKHIERLTRFLLGYLE